MKYKLIFLSITLITLLQIKGQEYIPLAVENAQWVILQDDTDTPYYDEFFGYKILGDTLINDILYKKVFKRSFHDVNNNFEPPYEITTEYLYGAIRDDIENRKVYGISFIDHFTCPTNEEFLMYDFSMNVGDTFQNQCLIIDSDYHVVDQIYYSNIYGMDRMIITGNFSCIELIEGVGSIYGLFEGIGCIVKGKSGYHSLYLYCIGLDEYCLDGFIVSVPYLQKRNNILKIFPNPSHDKLNVETNIFTDNRINTYIKISSILGHTNNIKFISSSNSTIDISFLPAGVYNITLYINNISVINEKFIKF